MVGDNHDRRILGISAFYHDAAAALVQGGAIVAAAHEERFTRKKHDPGFPAHAVRYCLEEAGLGLADLDAVVFYDKPFLKFERLLETYYIYAPRGVRSFINAVPVWIKEKVFLKDLLRRELQTIAGEGTALPPLLFTEHHLSHAASAYYPSPFDEAAILTIDGVGEWATASISHGQGEKITLLKELHFPHSVGLLYSAFTYYLGFRVNSGEYKLMGLAPYGDPQSPRTARYEQLIRTELIDLRDDGSLWLNPRYFDYATGTTMTCDAEWTRIFGFARRAPESDLTPEQCDLALAIQHVTEEVVLRMARTAQRLTGSRQLCLAGGVALNCVANGHLLRQRVFDDIWIQPAAGDAGGALGAALAVSHLYHGEARPPLVGLDRMQGSYLGPRAGDDDVARTAKRYRAPLRRYDDFDTLCREVAAQMAAGRTVGWCQGRMEWGPRSLGNRSILGDARSPEMQKRLNLQVKFRESFRPFAPAVLAEHAAEYFALDVPSPYMLLVAEVQTQRRCALPADYHQQPLREKLYHRRSDLPAITHLDFSARVQTIHRETNPRFWQLLSAFREATGCGVIVNTSFNVRGEPIVCTPEDAYRCFMRTDLDLLVINDCVFTKSEQPPWPEGREWETTYALD